MANSYKPNEVAYLKRIVGHPAGEIITLNQVKLTIGRQKTCDLWTPDPNVSRKHCTVYHVSTGWTIADLGGCNGTFVDTTQLEPCKQFPLKSGEIIYLGPPGSSTTAFLFLTTLPVKSSEIAKASPSEVIAFVDNALPDKSSEIAKASPSEVIACIDNAAGSVSNEENHDSKSGLKRNLICSIEATSSVKRQRIDLPAPSPIADHQIDDNDGDMSDCSISSLDSLKTRIQKMRKRGVLTSSMSDCTNVTNSALQSLDFDHVKNSESLLRGDPVDNEFHEKCQITETASSSQNCNGNSQFSSPKPCSSSSQENMYESLKKKYEDLESELFKVSSDLCAYEEQCKQHSTALKKMTLLNQVKHRKLLKVLEEELCCTICTEVLIKATLLNCSHTFCQHCIETWKKKKRQCPICRERIQTETRLLVMDNVIEKLVKYLGSHYKRKRQDILEQRECLQEKSRKEMKRCRKTHSRRNPVESYVPPVVPPVPPRILSLSPSGTIHTLGLASNWNRSEIEDEFNLIRSIDDVFDDYLPSSGEIQLNESLVSLGDSSIEGNGYYGGYGRCYNCGHRGHWANGCPDH